MLVSSGMIQKGQMLPLVHQMLMLVLAVNIHQQAGKLLILGEGGKRAVNPAGGAALGGDFPGQHQFVFRVLLGQALLLQKRAGGGAIGQVKQALHPGLIAPGADQLLLGAAPQQQRDGIHQDGFARARFAGEHMQPGIEFHLHFVHQGDVSNG